MAKKLTTEDFRQKSVIVHGGKYCYSKSCYTNNHTKVSIICPHHGVFEQVPKDHLRGIGCRKCAIDANRRNKEFFLEAKRVHNDFYDYSKVIYKRQDVPVIVICKKHGAFPQLPQNHLLGHGCKTCSDGKRRLTKKEFISKARSMHGEKYDYQKVEFEKTRGYVTIICPKHGSFNQWANHHLSGRGCRKCSFEKQTHTREKFIEKAIKKHGYRFDYSLVEYDNSRSQITIICPLHGEFVQTAYNHLMRGCKKCSNLNNPGSYNYKRFEQNLELAKSPGIFYIVRFDFPREQFIKIGITKRRVTDRFGGYLNNITVLLENAMPLRDAFHREQLLLHRKDLQPFRYHPRNISKGVNECFTLDAEAFLF